MWVTGTKHNQIVIELPNSLLYTYSVCSIFLLDSIITVITIIINNNNNNNNNNSDDDDDDDVTKILST